MKNPDYISFSHLFIISGPSGVGKGTIMKYLIDNAGLKKIVNYTTRPRRPNEIDGIDYFFVSKHDFYDLISTNSILEAEKVYGDYYYGSPRLVHKKSSENCVIELDPHGANRFKKEYGDRTTSLFILPPSVEALINRIKLRYVETNLIDRFLTTFKQMDSVEEYDYVILNDELSFACSEALAIILTTNNKYKFPSYKILVSKIKDNLLRNIANIQ